ncbi:hypothetical protein GpartN1_g2556.t1 [Galdieria partita]|uniref:Cytochrome c-553 n=1 Tax=Galdieria partita TaxID=83374 RepID=A0A9C7UPQ6_9RHOD|nr:hypothetical protein GpartN1_g2556.t1 [Galdieria partita]
MQSRRGGSQGCLPCFVVGVDKRWVAKRSFQRSLIDTKLCLSMPTGSHLSILSVIATQPLSNTAFNQAHTLFEQNCAACHSKGGNIIFYARNKTLFPKALEKNGYLNKESISEITRQGKGAMPGYHNKLDDEEISLLSDYILQRAADHWK